MSSIPYGILRDIANELKNIREILEKQQSIEVEEENTSEYSVDIIYPVGSYYYNNYGLAIDPNDVFDDTVWECCGRYWKRIK